MLQRSIYPKSRFLFIFLFGITFTLCLLLNRSNAIAQSPSSTQLVQQGVEQYQQGDLQSAIAQWEAALPFYESQNSLNDRAVILENLARAHQQTGNLEQAIDRWSKVVAVYRRLNNSLQVGRMQTEQAQTYTQLGQYREAIVLLCNVPQVTSCSSESSLQIARTLGDRVGEVAALGSLGEAYRLRGGERDTAAGSGNRQAGEYLEQGLKLAREIENPQFVIALLNSLGNNALNLAQINYRRANSAELIGSSEAALELRQGGLINDRVSLEHFAEGVRLAQQQQDQVNELRMLVSSIAPAYRTGEADRAIDLTQKAIALINQVPDAQEKVYAAIDLARLLQPIPPVNVAPNSDSQEPDAQSLVQLGGALGNQCYSATVEPQAIEILEQAIGVAQRIKDPRSESFVWGELGRIYECRKDYAQALDRTQKARLAAEQNLRAKDSLYLWEWQTGRILKAKGQLQEAMVAYDRAVTTLNDIRSELLNANRDLQFDFRDSVDPLYRQAVELRLALIDSQTDRPEAGLKQATEGTAQQNLNVVLDTVDQLRLAELQNYFGNDCVVRAVNQGQITSTDGSRGAAIINSIIFDDRTAIVATLPDGQKQFSWVDVSNEEFRREILNYRIALEDSFRRFDTDRAAKIYGWIIQPFADELRQSQIKTLVFVQDGILRNVSMAALYDRASQKFLIEEFSIATTPSLTLTALQPFDRRDLSVLALGVSEPTIVDGVPFSPLEFVTQEINSVAETISPSTVLLNQAFTFDRLQQALRRRAYSILHIATHGEFATDPQDTFLVTGDSQKLSIVELERLIRNMPSRGEVDLLALTACETSAGDDRASLGLAGVAIQAGARSALASLWAADDLVAAEVSAQFYRDLLQNPTMSKAEALQAAQIRVLKAGGDKDHPSFWAPFTLIGNWL